MRVSLLLGIQLDDEVFLDRQINVIARGDGHDLANHAVGVVIQPLRRRTGSVGFDVGLDLVETLAGVLECNNHARLDQEAGDVDFAAIHGEVAVRHELARLGAAHRKAETVDDVVQTGLEDREQVLARDALTLLRHGEVAAELLLEHAVIAADLLLLAQLGAVLRGLAAALAVLTGGVASALERALLGVASVALEEELLAPLCGTDGRQLRYI